MADPEREWLRTTYRGDVPQLTPRAFVMGSLLGAIMALSNLYVGLKTGWGLGVAITASVLSFSLYSLFTRIVTRVTGGRLAPKNLSIVENACMASTASAAGYGTGSTVISAMSALLLVEGHHLPWPAFMAWTFFLALLGTVIAIPMKRQMVNVEQLRFPTGLAAAETLKSLYAAAARRDAGSTTASAAAEGSSTEGTPTSPRSLFVALGLGALVTWLRDAHAVAKTGVLAVLTRFSSIPALIPIPGLAFRGVPALRYTVALEGSLIFVAVGALLGLRTTASMAFAGLLNYAVLAPWAKDHGAIKDLGYRGIVTWSIWPGTSLMVTSGLLTFVLQWRTVVRAFAGVGQLLRGGGAAGGEADPVAEVEVPTSWFLIGTAVATVGVVTVAWLAFGIAPWLGLLAVFLAFVLAVVACRATGETDITPIGALGKVAQLTYGVLAPARIGTNLLTASITAASSASAADLLTDLKCGYVLGAKPRKQFLAQLAGVFVGTLVVVPAFYLLVPTASAIGTEKFPAPAAQVWRGVAEVLAKGVDSLHVSSLWGIAIGGAVGIVLPVLEHLFPRHKRFLPSPMGVGLAFVMPCFNALSMFLGALLAWAYARAWPRGAGIYTVPVASGIIAGESLLGVAVALLGAFGYLE